MADFNVLLYYRRGVKLRAVYLRPYHTTFLESLFYITLFQPTSFNNMNHDKVYFGLSHTILIFSLGVPASIFAHSYFLKGKLLLCKQPSNHLTGCLPQLLGYYCGQDEETRHYYLIYLAVSATTSVIMVSSEIVARWVYVELCTQN